MKRLISLARLVESLSDRVGRSVAWLVVAAALISAGNAIVRKLFDLSSNAWLEAQWWLFALVFLLAAPWTLARNGHIRIDVLSNRFPGPLKNAVEIIGHVFFLLPSAAMILVTSWFYFLTSFSENEQSSNAGGLPQWPIKALIPVAFALLLLQGVAELIKRIAIIRGELAEREEHGSYHEVAAAMGEEMQAGKATTGKQGGP